MRMTETPQIDSDARLEEAINWMVELSSGEVSDSQVRAFDQWVRREPENEAIWLRLQDGLGPVNAIARNGLAKRGLTKRLVTIQTSRRRFVKGIAAIAGFGIPAVAAVDRFVPLAHLAADHMTGTGERKSVDLEDGSRVTMAARSAFDQKIRDGVRSIRLESGQVLLSIASGPTPFVARVANFSLVSERGSFMVEKRGRTIAFTALSGAASIDAPWPLVLDSGNSATYDGDTPPLEERIDPASASAWTQGLLIADNHTISSIVEDIRPYFPGIIRLGSGIGHLRASGAFKLDQPLQSLETLALSLGLRVRSLSRYWISVEHA